MLLKFVSTLWEIRIPSQVLGMSSRVQGLCALTRGSFSCRLPISGRCRAGLLMTRTMVSAGPARVRGVGLSHSPAPHLLFVFLCCVSTCSDQPWHFFHAILWIILSNGELRVWPSCGGLDEGKCLSSYVPPRSITQEHIWITLLGREDFKQKIRFPWVVKCVPGSEPKAVFLEIWIKPCIQRWVFLYRKHSDF